MSINQNMPKRGLVCQYCHELFKSGALKCQHARFYCDRNENREERTRLPKRIKEPQLNKVQSSLINTVALVESLCDIIKDNIMLQQQLIQKLK
jgi:hypothetical protein